MNYPKLNGKQLSGKNKVIFTYLRNAIKESIAFDNDARTLNLSDKEIDTLSWNAAFSTLSGVIKDFIHLLNQ